MSASVLVFIIIIVEFNIFFWGGCTGCSLWPLGLVAPRDVGF